MHPASDDTSASAAAPVDCENTIYIVWSDFAHRKWVEDLYEEYFGGQRVGREMDRGPIVTIVLSVNPRSCCFFDVEPDTERPCV